MFLGELISFGVLCSWTVCALFSEVASKRMSALPFNVVRMTLSLLMLMGVMTYCFGAPYPVGSDFDTWLWLSLSGLVGYVLGDFCLFNCYILIGSRYGQLLMTLAPPAAALFGWVLLGEHMAPLALLGMAITVAGIATSVYRPRSKRNTQPLSLRGVLFGIGAGVGQGVGLVLSAKGLHCYEASLAESEVVVRGTMVALPCAATAIRAVTGLLGFSLWTWLNHQGPKLRTAVRDGRSMLFALGATLTGPFIGVSLSLMATQYTSTGVAQTIMALTPIFILLPTRFIFKQPITMREVVGAVIAVLGVALFFV